MAHYARLRAATFATTLLIATGLLSPAAAQSREEMVTAAPAAAPKPKPVPKAPDQPRVKVVYRDRVAKPVERVVYRNRPGASPSIETDWGDREAMWSKGFQAERAKNYILSIKYYTRAAELGSTLAMRSLSQLYKVGIGIKQDSAQALAWYKKGVAAGDTDAMLDLGSMYWLGFSVNNDYAQARYWFQKAADAGNEHAKEYLQNIKGR